MSTADEIAKLHDLLTRGAITQAEYEQQKARLLAGAPAGAGAGLEINRFRLSDTDKWLGGVCGGIGQITGVESWIWRLLFAIAAFFGGAGAIVYLLLWIFVPRENEPQ